LADRVSVRRHQAAGSLALRRARFHTDLPDRVLV
jgi:hypothetical protein